MAKAWRIIAAAGITVTAVYRGAVECAGAEDERKGALAVDGRATTPVRSTRTEVVALIGEGVSRSPTFARLVATLRASDVVAYVELALKMPNGLNGYLANTVLAAGGRRYLRIVVDAGLEHDRLIAIVAHELQHAVEVAQAADVNSNEAARRLFRRLDSGRCRIGCTETDAAQRIQESVLHELRVQRVAVP